MGSLVAFDEHHEFAEDLAEVAPVYFVDDEDVVLASELLERINLVRESMIQNKVPMPERDVFVGQVLDRLIIEEYLDKKSPSIHDILDSNSPTCGFGYRAQAYSELLT